VVPSKAVAVSLLVASIPSVIRAPEVHRQVLLDVLDYAAGAGWQVCGLIASPLLGPKGNREFLVWRQRLAEARRLHPDDVLETIAVAALMAYPRDDEGKE
jgi:hypothetical protein